MNVPPAGLVSVLGIRDATYAQDLVLAAIGRLDLLTAIADEPSTLDELCAHHDIAYQPADVLCTLLRSMELLEPGDVLRPTGLALACLVDGAPQDLRPYVSLAASRPTCLATAELLRTGVPPDSGPWLGRATNGHVVAESAGYVTGLFAATLADRLGDLAIHRVLEVGSDGACGRALRSAREDVRVSFVDGELAAWPTDHDMHLFAHVLHRWNAREIRQALGLSYKALDSGGWIVDYDVHLNADKSGPLSSAQYSAALLSTSQGKCWSVAEITALLDDVGFVNVAERPTAAGQTAIIAQKPVTE